MSEQKFTVITDVSQIPEFKSEKEEADFWATHSLGEGMLSGAEADADTQALLALIPARPRPPKSNPISLRLGVDLERRLRVLADKKGTTYQTLMKEFVLERTYEEEKRLGLV